MIKHIVMWNVKNEHFGQPKSELLKEMKKRLFDLKGKISVIENIDVQLNTLNSDKNADIILITDFNNIEDLNTYAQHPDHILVVEYVRQIVTGRSCVDYEY